MNNEILDAVINLAHEAFPDLEKLIDYEDWMAGSFNPPCLFIQVQHVAERAATLTMSRVIYDAGIVVHYPKAKGIFQPISTEPLSNVLRRERFQYPTFVNGKRILLNIDPDSYRIRLTERKDRAEITFRLDVPVRIPEKVYPKIEEFDIEMG